LKTRVGADARGPLLVIGVVQPLEQREERRLEGRLVGGDRSPEADDEGVEAVLTLDAAGKRRQPLEQDIGHLGARHVVENHVLETAAAKHRLRPETGEIDVPDHAPHGLDDLRRGGVGQVGLGEQLEGALEIAVIGSRLRAGGLQGLGSGLR